MRTGVSAWRSNPRRTHLRPVQTQPGPRASCRGRTFTSPARSAAPTSIPTRRSFRSRCRRPKGAPNIVLILIDDAGFGQFGTFGGGVPSPTLDRLAAEGLRYNRFHTTALCCPTRAALHHRPQPPLDRIRASSPRLATGYDGYTCIMPQELRHRSARCCGRTAT